MLCFVYNVYRALKKMPFLLWDEFQLWDQWIGMCMPAASEASLLNWNGTNMLLAFKLHFQCGMKVLYARYRWNLAAWIDMDSMAERSHCRFAKDFGPFEVRSFVSLILFTGNHFPTLDFIELFWIT